MKKFIITFLGIIFLLPAVASAGSYCVSFPTSGETKWTKRDNNIGVRFRYDFGHVSAIGLSKDTIYDPPFWTTGGALKGSGRANPIVKDYTYYPYSTRDLCIYDPFRPIPRPELVHVRKLEYQGRGRTYDYNDYYLTLSPAVVRLDVKWGGDCPTVRLNNERITGGDHQFEIYHRKGDLVNPFGCRRK